MIWVSKNITKAVFHSNTNNAHLKLTTIIFILSGNKINSYHILRIWYILANALISNLYNQRASFFDYFNSLESSLPSFLTSLQIANCNTFYLNKDVNKTFPPLPPSI